MLDFFFNIILYWGLPLIFILLFFEGNPIIGSFIPGGAIVISLGFLQATSSFTNIYTLLFIVFLGGFLGDIMGYYLGRKFGVLGLEKFGLNNKSTIFTSSKRFFKKFGFYSIILGREFNLTRAFIPFFAAIFHMKVKNFVFLAFISNIIWACVNVYLGFYFGLIIIQKIELFFSFLIFVVLYFLFLFFIYKSFKNLYIKNYILFRDYAFSNILYLSFSLILLILFLFFKHLKLDLLFNNIFSFLLFPFMSHFSFLLSGKFLLFVLWLLFMFLIYSKRLNLLLILIWGSVISVLISLILFYILFHFFSIKFYISIVFISEFIFFLFFIFKSLFKIKNKILFDFYFVFILSFMVLIKFEVTHNLYLVILSLIISVIISEIITLLSHYNIINSKLSSVINKS